MNELTVTPDQVSTLLAASEHANEHDATLASRLYFHDQCDNFVPAICHSWQEQRREIESPAQQLYRVGKLFNIRLNELYATSDGQFVATLCTDNRNLRGNGKTPIESIEQALNNL